MAIRTLLIAAHPEEIVQALFASRNVPNQKPFTVKRTDLRSYTEAGRVSSFIIQYDQEE